ncbi:MAG: nicotinate-nucleotide--dimethylbenzimidazole phosphoribosyltransferase [Candidatus Nanopelagicales bacterium]|nr:nicotinate-nucleotide--dimethylbenzimidazole phosphoribosyltransferase [Candidatus Nanopelagicales bacterium]
MEQARARHLTIIKPAGSLGRLESIGIWAAGVQGRCPPRPFMRPRVVVFVGDHSVARTVGTSAYPPEVTAQMVLNFISGGAAVNVLARQGGAEVRVIDVSVDCDVEYLSALGPEIAQHRIRRGSGSIDREDALTQAESAAAFELGQRIADEEIDSGADILIAGDMGIGNTTPAATLVGLLASADAAAVTGLGTGIDDATWMRKCAAVRDAMRRGRPFMGSPQQLLQVVGGADIAAMSGFLLQAALRRTPVILDGTITTAAALAVDRMDYRAKSWWIAGHLAAEPAHSIALSRLDMIPLLDYQMRLGEGTGALLALPIVQSAIALLHDMATFTEAGVSGRGDLGSS